jgi:hypothetical protein
MLSQRFPLQILYYLGHPISNKRKATFYQEVGELVMYPVDKYNCLAKAFYESISC